MSTITQPRETLIQLHLELESGGRHAYRVEEWLIERFPHLDARVEPVARDDGALGLSVALKIPPPDPQDDRTSWAARFQDALGPLDAGLFVLEACLTAIGVDPCDVTTVRLSPPT